MKHLKLVTICLGLALIFTIATEADAGRLNKRSKESRTEKTEEESMPVRFDNYPDMEFVGGILSQDSLAGWKIGDTPLYVTKKCMISGQGARGGALVEGERAVVMGARLGNAISAWSIVISKKEFGTRLISETEAIKEPGPNPDVGQLSQRPD